MVNSKLSPYAPEWSSPHNRASSSSSGTITPVAAESNATTETRSPQKLNPNAPEWSLADNRGTEPERCLFVTFSKWLPPLDEAELTMFFDHMFGHRCVQSIAMFNGNEGPNPPPKSAKVVFKTKTIPMRILADKNEVSLTLYGKTIWCKRYKPKKKYSQKG